MPPRLYAHRGAAAEEPENTLPSFARALEHGADALETDVHVTSDGHVVASHDPDGARMTGVGAAIRRTPLAEVQRWDAGWGFLRGGARPFAGKGYRIPTLEELLAAFPHTLVNIDIKQHDAAAVDTVVALLRRLRVEERVLVASFSSRVLARARRIGWRGATALGREDVLRVLALPAFAQQLAARIPWLDLRGRAAQVPVQAGRIRLATPSFLAKCRALGVRVDYWTINDPAQARALLDLGADGIMTDDPATIAPVLKPGTGS
jgi:glycerophosphoryl diester phosphodiesterase